MCMSPSVSCVGVPIYIYIYIYIYVYIALIRQPFGRITIFSRRSNFYAVDNLSTAVHAYLCFHLKDITTKINFNKFMRLTISADVIILIKTQEISFIVYPCSRYSDWALVSCTWNEGDHYAFLYKKITLIIVPKGSKWLQVWKRDEGLGLISLIAR